MCSPWSPDTSGLVFGDDAISSQHWLGCDIEQAPHLREVFKIRGVPSLYTFESDDFKDFENIEQIVIGHSHEQYSNLRPSLDELTKS